MSHTDARTPEELAARSDEAFVDWTEGVIAGAAVMARFRCRYPEGVNPFLADHESTCLTHADDRLVRLAYAEAARRHPKAPLYTRAYNRFLHGQGAANQVGPEDWTLA